MTTDYYTPGELAAVLKVSTKTLRNWRYRGEGPRHIRLVGVTRYPADTVNTWLDAHTA